MNANQLDKTLEELRKVKMELAKANSLLQFAAWAHSIGPCSSELTDLITLAHETQSLERWNEVFAMKTSEEVT
jgi:hypothetical protein